MEVASDEDVRGPVATMDGPQSSGGSAATSPSSTQISGCARSVAVTPSEKPSRSTASAPPAGSMWRSPIAITSEPARRISAWSSPTAFVSASSERNELEQTNSAKPPVLCAGVIEAGRISWRTTEMPASASCHAASEPARPPPITWIFAECSFMPAICDEPAGDGKGGQVLRCGPRQLPPCTLWSTDR